MPTYFFRFFFVPRAPCSPARQKECTLRVRKCCPQSYGPWIGSVDFLAWGAYLGPVSAHGPASWPCSYAVPMRSALPRSPAPMGTGTPPHAAVLSVPPAFPRAPVPCPPAMLPPCSCSYLARVNPRQGHAPKMKTKKHAPYWRSLPVWGFGLLRVRVDALPCPPAMLPAVRRAPCLPSAS